MTVNGRSARQGRARLLLVHFLRESLGLTGTHVGCDTSNCGACTVHVDGEAVKSCTVLAVQADGREVTTIEGMASEGELHPLQTAFWEKHGLQCGFCTPGMIMAAADLLGPNSSPVRGGRARGAGGQPVPLHGLSEHRQGRHGRSGRGAGMGVETPEATQSGNGCVGQSLKRKEDPRLITGRATYVEDIMLPGMLHAALVRSSEAHAKIRRSTRRRRASSPA